MKQGSTFYLIVDLNVEVSKIDSVIFTLKNRGVNLTKEDWQYKNGKFEIPFTQEESVNLEGRTLIEAQINFSDGSVAKTQIKEIYIKETLATRIIDGNVATQEGKEFELLVEEDVIYTSEDYEKLGNKPSINGVTLVGDTSLDALNIASKDYVEEEIAKFDFIKIVDVLPEVGLPNRIYFVPKSNTSDNDLFDEYAWINDSWEFYGTKQIEVDLTNYVKFTDIANKSKAGIARIYGTGEKDVPGVGLTGNNILTTVPATTDDINSQENTRKPIVSSVLSYAVMKALTDPKNHEWTEEEKAKALELLGAVQQNTSTNDKKRFYGVNEDGTAILKRANSDQETDGLMIRDGAGRARVNEPEHEKDIANKKYVDEGFVSQVKTSSSLQRVYAISQDGTQKVLNASENPFANALVLFGQGGIVKVGTPTKDNHATTKKYVDDLVGDIETLLGGI